ncbi:hypothetical protein L7F22_022022 [Adiantum nelumboides]|nr:hypothetical protein [Adiantum nelumboides]
MAPFPCSFSDPCGRQTHFKQYRSRPSTFDNKVAMTAAAKPLALELIYKLAKLDVTISKTAGYDIFSVYDDDIPARSMALIKTDLSNALGRSAGSFPGFGQTESSAEDMQMREDSRPEDGSSTNRIQAEHKALKNVKVGKELLQPGKAIRRRSPKTLRLIGL